MSIPIHHHNQQFWMASFKALIVFSLIYSGCFFIGSVAASEPEINRADDRLCQQIDYYINQAKRREGIISSHRSSDAEFMRRVSLDLTGKIPTVAQLRSFLADNDSSKREKLIDRLLASPGYIEHFTNIWRKILIPEASTDLQARSQIPEFDAWLRFQFKNNTQYDDMIRQIIDVPLDLNRRDNAENTEQRLTPRAYYLAKQVKPENLAASTSRALLGVRIECAQCHDHPFDNWKQQQFWQFAAFFSNIDQSQSQVFGTTVAIREVDEKPQIKIPDTNRIVDAKFLDGNQPEWIKGQSKTRRQLSQWIISEKNPYFANATTNRIWSLFFGRGIIDPVDDISATNHATHPDLLDILATRFREHNYNLKYLIREITNTETYQLTSQQTDASQSQTEWYGKMPTRGLTAEQIFANLVQATGFFQQTTDGNTALLNPGANSPQSEILELFQADSENSLEPRATILQALSLMNGTFMTNTTSLEESDVFTAIVDFPDLSEEKKIEAFFLAALSRRPTEQELKRLKIYVTSADSEESQVHAYSNLFWALLNSSEFLLNH